jgi:hypothetical protein
MFYQDRLTQQLQGSELLACTAAGAEVLLRDLKGQKQLRVCHT